MKPKELISTTTRPVPIFTINYKSDPKDPATAMLIRKQKHEAEKQRLKNRLIRLKNSPDMITGDMKQYMEMMESDPAPNIGTEFDWHFSGGNLKLLDIKSENYLVQPSMCSDYDLRLLTPSRYLQHIELQPKSKCFGKNYGYEIMTSSAFLGLRRRKSVSLIKRFNIIPGKPNFHVPIEFKWNTGIAASALSNEELIIVDEKQNLVRSNIGEMLVNSSMNLPIDDPKHRFPISVSAIDNNVVSYTDLKSLSLVDKRENKVHTIFNDENFYMKCEELSHHQKSAKGRVLFLASSHILYGIDLRQYNDMMMHWTHQLIMQPTLMTSVMLAETEVICLASNMPGDLKIFNCEKGWKPHSYRINHLPVKPRTLKASYSAMRDKGKLLLCDPIQHRLSLSTTGIAMAVKEKNSAVELYTQNSIGDIFRSELKCRDDQRVDDMRVEANFEEWAKVLETPRNPLKFLSTKERLQSKKLQFTDVVSLKGVAKVLRCEKLQTGEDPEVVPMSTVRVPRWKMDLEDAREYRDALSQHILAEWDLDLEDCQPQLFAAALKASGQHKDKSMDKVSRWLEESSIADEDIKVEDEDLSVINEVFNEPTATQPADKGVKSKKVRVKGF